MEEGIVTPIPQNLRNSQPMLGCPFKSIRDVVDPGPTNYDSAQCQWWTWVFFDTEQLGQLQPRWRNRLVPPIERAKRNTIADIALGVENPLIV